MTLHPDLEVRETEAAGLLWVGRDCRTALYVGADRAWRGYRVVPDRSGVSVVELSRRTGAELLATGRELAIRREEDVPKVLQTAALDHDAISCSNAILDASLPRSVRSTAERALARTLRDVDSRTQRRSLARILAEALGAEQMRILSEALRTMSHDQYVLVLASDLHLLSELHRALMALLERAAADSGKSEWRLTQDLIRRTRLVESVAGARLTGDDFATVLRNSLGRLCQAGESIDAPLQSVLARWASLVHRTELDWTSACENWERAARVDAADAVLTRPSIFDRSRDDQEVLEIGEAEANQVVADFESHTGKNPSDSVVLDYGCGIGRIAVPLAERFKQVDAVDVAPTMIKQARKYAEQRQVGDRINFWRVGEPELRSVPDNHYDLIVAAITIPHIAPPNNTISLAALVGKLREGGVLIFDAVSSRGWTFPVSPQLRRRAYSFLPQATLRDLVEMHGLPESEMHRVVSASGGNVAEVRPKQVCKGWAGYKALTMRRRVDKEWPTT